MTVKFVGTGITYLKTVFSCYLYLTQYVHLIPYIFSSRGYLTALPWFLNWYLRFQNHINLEHLAVVECILLHNAQWCGSFSSRQDCICSFLQKGWIPKSHWISCSYSTLCLTNFQPLTVEACITCFGSLHWTFKCCIKVCYNWASMRNCSCVPAYALFHHFFTRYGYV